MKRISAKSNLGQHFVEAYNRSTKSTLEDVYAKPSEAKQTAFKRCRQICMAEKGHCFKIISANKNIFTVAFEIKDYFGATKLRVMTRYHDYIIYFGDKL